MALQVPVYLRELAQPEWGLECLLPVRVAKKTADQRRLRRHPSHSFLCHRHTGRVLADTAARAPGDLLVLCCKVLASPLTPVRLASRAPESSPRCSLVANEKHPNG